MKTLATTLLLIALVFVAVRCDSQLDLAPIGELSSENFFNNERDFEAASLAPYSTLLNLYYDNGGDGWWNGVFLVGDDVRHPQGSNDTAEFRWLPGNGSFSVLWNEPYKGIMRSNVILNRLAAATGFSDENNKLRFEAEAKFVRAYFYFLLARTFGNVPMVDFVIERLDDARIGNSQPGEIWNLIESDLQFAKSNLPAQWNDENTGRATSYAAVALLGKILLYRAQWEGNSGKYGESINAFNEVINSGEFQLTTDFGDNFREETENNEESVFEIQMTRGDFNPWLPVDFGLEGNQNIGAAGTARKIYSGAACHTGNCAPGANGDGYGRFHVTVPMQNAFEPNDPRVFHTYYSAGEDYAGTPFDPAWSITGATPAKYVRPFVMGFPPNWSGNNERIIRYADVLLMLAEAELLGNGNVGRAAELINQVRDRARSNYVVVYGQPAPDGTLEPRSSGVSVDQMFQWLMHERQVELALEAHRYDDLVRWHRAGLIDIAQDIDFGNTVANQSWNPRHLLRPVPQSELDNNPAVTQNPGY